MKTSWQVWATAVKSMGPGRGQAGMRGEARRPYVDLTLYPEGPRGEAGTCLEAERVGVKPRSRVAVPSSGRIT